MGCVPSKGFPRTASFQGNLKRPFPPITAILDDLVLANNTEFVSLICKANKLANKVPASSESENILTFISKYSEGERLISGKHLIANTDMQTESSLKDEKSEKHEPAEGESEEYKPTEKDRMEIIFTWELMEGLDDGEMCDVSRKTGPDSDSLSANSSDRSEELIHETARAGTSRSKSMESFHTVEEYDAFLARRRRPPRDRNSKRHLYFLGHEHTETTNEFSSSSLSRLYSYPPVSLSCSNMMPVVIDWEKESENDVDFSPEFAVLQPSFTRSGTKKDINGYIAYTASENISSEENKGMAETVSENNSRVEDNGIAQTTSENNSRVEDNGIAQTTSENSGSQENSHIMQTNMGSTGMEEENVEENQSTQANLGKRRMDVRAKPDDLGGTIIPSTAVFSSIGSLKDWLTGDGHLSSAGVSTGLSLGYSEFGDEWSMANDAGNYGQQSSDGAKMETDYYPVLNIDDKLANDGDSSVYSDSEVSDIENKQWEYPLFDPDLLASFEEALKQLSEEEQNLLRQIEEDANLLSRKSSAKDNEDDLQDSSRTVNTKRQIMASL